TVGGSVAPARGAGTATGPAVAGVVTIASVVVGAAAGAAPAGALGAVPGGPDCGGEQARSQVGPCVVSRGRSCRHRSVACAHRGTTGRCRGGSVSNGIPPAVAVTGRPSTSGTEASRARVYGCAGSRSTCWVGPLSTTVPAYSTTTRS